jgi:hypothetical protein
MTDELAAFGVRVIALSKDSPGDAANHRERDGLAMSLLSDPRLEVIERFGVLHRGALEFSTLRFSIMGIPLALVPSFKTMAIPTSILVDDRGTIRWIDQADDYRLRSGEARVLDAVRRAFGDDRPSAASPG